MVFRWCRRCAAYPLAQGNSRTRGLALEGTDDQLSVLEEVKAYPIYLGQCVIDQRRGIGGVGQRV